MISIHALREEGDFLQTFCRPISYFISIHALREEGDVAGSRRGVVTHISIHALREEGDRCRIWHRRKAKQFLSTPSARRATFLFTGACCPFFISIHALREEGDSLYSVHLRIRFQFLSTPSARRATSRTAIGYRLKGIISIHALREEGDRDRSQTCRRSEISIHALREEGDRVFGAGAVVHQLISIHALREEGDVQKSLYNVADPHFYPRPPRGGRHCSASDCSCTVQFLSTPSARRATCHRSCFAPARFISIHALREEGDLCDRCTAKDPVHFYPRPPRGGRRTFGIAVYLVSQQFLSTPSARRATRSCCTSQCFLDISIHALREEGDTGCGRSAGNQTHFYPRPPRGGRRQQRDGYKGNRRFLSTPSARRATATTGRWTASGIYFYPRPPRGGRLE